MDKLQISESKWINVKYISSFVIVETKGDEDVEICFTMTNGDCHCMAFRSKELADIFLIQYL